MPFGDTHRRAHFAADGSHPPACVRADVDVICFWDCGVVLHRLLFFLLFFVVVFVLNVYPTSVCAVSGQVRNLGYGWRHDHDRRNRRLHLCHQRNRGRPDHRPRHRVLHVSLLLPCPGGEVSTVRA